MKKTVLFLAVALTALTAYAAVLNPNAIPSSFRGEVIKQVNLIDDRLDVIESSTSGLTNSLYAADGVHEVRVAKASYSFADGDLAVGAHGLGVSLPAKAVITRSWIHVTLQQVDTGTCTVAISCEDANNIKTATDISGSAADALVEGQSTGAASAFIKSIAAACEITLTVADGGSCVPSAGTGQVFVEYVVQN